MRIALLSDIHGNSIALDAVLEDIKAQGSVDGYWVLGDLAAIGFDPIGALERLAQLPEAIFIRGNADRYLLTGERPAPTLEECEADPSLWKRWAEVASSFAWTQGAVMGAGWLNWLAGLPLERRFLLPDGTRVLCVHASPGCDDGPGVDAETSEATLKSLLAASEADLVCVGHTHWPLAVKVDGRQVVNPGSLSNVFAPDLRASYVLLEADKTSHHLQHRRVAYDREAVIAGLRQVNHPAADHIVRFMRGEIYPPWLRDR